MRKIALPSAAFVRHSRRINNLYKRSTPSVVVARGLAWCSLDLQWQASSASRGALYSGHFRFPARRGILAGATDGPEGLGIEWTLNLANPRALMVIGTILFFVLAIPALSLLTMSEDQS
jgi:hypothetical protein